MGTIRSTSDESSLLLGRNGHGNSSSSGKGDVSNQLSISSAVKYIICVAVGVVLGLVLAPTKDTTASIENYTTAYSNSPMNAGNNIINSGNDDDTGHYLKGSGNNSYDEDDDKSSSISSADEAVKQQKEELQQLLPFMSTNSKYTSFQALNFQVYTGGAPIVVTRNVTLFGQEGEDEEIVYLENITNPECYVMNQTIGVDIIEGTRQCYLGHDDTDLDVEDRLAIMYDAVEKAYEAATAQEDSSTLKIFIAPEFFFRGRNGAYLVPPYSNGSDDDNENGPNHNTMPLFLDDEHGECQAEICKILAGLEDYIADERFKDWLFLFGTVIVAEPLPVEDEYDYLFYNFGLLYKGYDPDNETQHGKRFLVPKRYVSKSDFLFPDTSTEEKMLNTKEILETAVSQEADFSHGDPEGDFYVPLRLKYDRHLWHNYKEELEKLDYIMIEYGWFMMDGLTFTVEICLDHDLRAALTAFLVDSVLPTPTLIPSSRDGKVEYVDIPRYQAQISLVASAGMTVSETSMALVNEGSIILQDGQENDEPEMIWSYECFKYEWQFVGGSEVVQRNATMTPTEVVFNYNVSKAFEKHSIYGDEWGQSLRGVFSTAKYEPMIRVFEPSPIAKVF